MSREYRCGFKPLKFETCIPSFGSDHGGNPLTFLAEENIYRKSLYPFLSSVDGNEFGGRGRLDKFVQTLPTEILFNRHMLRTWILCGSWYSTTTTQKLSPSLSLSVLFLLSIKSTEALSLRKHVRGRERQWGSHFAFCSFDSASTYSGVCSGLFICTTEFHYHLDTSF